MPYFDSTDHLVFVDSVGRRAGHDPDQLAGREHPLERRRPLADGRDAVEENAFVVAATALWLANADSPDVARLAPFVTARGLERIAQDVATAADWIHSGKGKPRIGHEPPGTSWILRSRRKAAAIASIQSLGPSDAMLASVLSSRQDELRKVARMIRDSVTMSSTVADGSVWNTGPSETERRLEKRVPRKAAATLTDWLALQRKVADKRADEARRRRRDERDALAGKPTRGKAAAKDADAAAGGEEAHALMQWEAMNWATGKSDAATIARRVCAEALSAGSWYYGDCSPEMVERFFETQAKRRLNQLVEAAGPFPATLQPSNQDCELRAGSRRQA